MFDKIQIRENLRKLLCEKYENKFKYISETCLYLRRKYNQWNIITRENHNWDIKKMSNTPFKVNMEIMKDQLKSSRFGKYLDGEREKLKIVRN